MKQHCRKTILLCFALIAAVAPAFLFADEPTVKRAPIQNLAGNGGFESRLTAPWGTGLYSQGKPIWWTSKECRCTAQADQAVRKSGIFSLRITNYSPSAPHVYGTTAQRIAIAPARTYRITLWAKASRLASNGAVFIVVDNDWKIRPIALPKGSYSWRKFTGTFSLPANHADVRIVSQDRGLVWIDDIQIVPMQGEFSG